ncbi:DUF1033 family protein [Jeotgalibacillus campisalis]|uniref:DUF1033 family protein n=1 Tax=Jeotgalibacillus campisalis TaxID=220754 RepID=A0A0C2RC93_9BACL|nr:DUF1033 family protein [Jeotgalibacillus campisalis]KIL47910.1 hypothetical protein KR50_20770 [Jeotgalibacillus campisalis]
MWNIIQTKSDAEPWWFLEGWEEDILQQWTFSKKEEAFSFYQKKISEMLEKYPNVREKRGSQIAFWDEKELLFCDSCDDDLQLYHGFLIFHHDEPYVKNSMALNDKQFFEQLIPISKRRAEAD